MANETEQDGYRTFANSYGFGIMSLPLWVRAGAKCVCIDDHWNDIFETGSPGPFPKKNERFTVAGTQDLDGAWFLILAEQHVAPDFYAVTAFRPLTPLERDVSLFESALKGVAALKRRDLVPAE